MSASLHGVARVLPVLRRVLVACALIWIITVLTVFARRFGYPLELEWMEGGVLHQALRVTRGEALYPPPGPDFIPFLYTPLYPIVLAGLGSVFGIGFWLARAVSILATIAAGGALAYAVLGEGKPRAHALIGVGLFAGGWVFSYRWLDLARPDALYLALVAWGIAVLRRSRGSHRRALLAGLLVALAFWTKQTAASFVIASGLAAVFVAPRQLPSYVAIIALVDGGGLLVGNAMTDGLLWTYIYELHQAHAFNQERFTTKTWSMFAHAAPWLVLLVLGLSARLIHRRARPTAAGEAKWTGLAYWASIAAAAMLVSALGYATQWAEPNAFVPGVFFGALLIAVALPVGGVAEVVALTLVAAQLLFAYLVEPHFQPVQKDGLAGLSRSYRWRDVTVAIPSERQRKQAAAFRERLLATSGDVLALNRPWWSVLAGGEGHVGSMGLTDVPPATRAEIQAEIRRRVRDRDYAEIWFEGEPPVWLRRELSRGYRVQRRLQGKERVRPMSGWMSVAGTIGPYRRDQVLLVPRGERPRSPNVEVIADFEGGKLDGFSTNGRAFGGRPVRGRAGKLPMAGPYGGEYLLSSAGGAGRLLDTGEVLSGLIDLPERGALVMLLGSTGRRRGLLVEIVSSDESQRAKLTIPRGRHRLSTVRWPITPQWAGLQVRLRLEDASPEGALYLDDLWLDPKND